LLQLGVQRWPNGLSPAAAAGGFDQRVYLDGCFLAPSIARVVGFTDHIERTPAVTLLPFAEFLDSAVTVISRSRVKILHIALHFIVPALAARLFFRQSWRIAYLVMICTMLVDLDHLLANPVYDAGRCSIGFHPLHGWLPVAMYVLLIVPPRSRVVGVGLAIQMALDSLDCQFTSGVWFV
jgi:hypothetical protein